jgi:hypothetical protein
MDSTFPSWARVFDLMPAFGAAFSHGRTRVARARGHGNEQNADQEAGKKVARWRAMAIDLSNCRPRIRIDAEYRHQSVVIGTSSLP